MQHERRCDHAEADNHRPVNPTQKRFAVKPNINAREEAPKNKGENTNIVNSQHQIRETEIVAAVSFLRTEIGCSLTRMNGSEEYDMPTKAAW